MKHPAILAWLTAVVFGLGVAAGHFGCPTEPPIPRADPPGREALGDDGGPLRSTVRAWVDQRLQERLNPTDAEIEQAVEAAMRGEKLGDKGGPSSWFAGAIAAVVWKVLKVAMGAVVLAALVALFWSYWYYFAGAGGLLAAWIEWRARAAAKKS